MATSSGSRLNELQRRRGHNGRLTFHCSHCGSWLSKTKARQHCIKNWDPILARWSQTLGRRDLEVQDGYLTPRELLGWQANLVTTSAGETYDEGLFPRASHDVDGVDGETDLDDGLCLSQSSSLYGINRDEYSDEKDDEKNNDRERKDADAAHHVGDDRNIHAGIGTDSDDHHQTHAHLRSEPSHLIAVPEQSTCTAPDSKQPPDQDVPFVEPLPRNKRPPSPRFAKLRKLFVLLRQWQFGFAIPSRAMTKLYQIIQQVLVPHDPTPITEYHVVQELNLDRSVDDFVSYVVCPKCYNLTTLSHALQRDRSEDTVRVDDSATTAERLVWTTTRCIHRPWPNHPRMDSRGSCDEPLMERRNNSKKLGRKCWTPRMTFAYRNPIRRIAQFLARPGFADQCRQWSQRHNPRDDLDPKQPASGWSGDIYDGKQWQNFNEFLNVNEPSQLNLLFQLNYDGFQPFDRVVFEAGALYLSLLNLPREVRNLRDNMILVGVLPGDKQYSMDMNQFLRPLVDDLLSFWSPGVRMTARGELDNSQSVLWVRGALINVACDLPAVRSIIGFAACTAINGCHCCRIVWTNRSSSDAPGRDRRNMLDIKDDDAYKLPANDDDDDIDTGDDESKESERVEVKEADEEEKPGHPISANASSSIRCYGQAGRKAKMRDYKSHVINAIAWRDAKSSSQRAELCRSNGVKWTDLLRLPYFNPITMTSVDVMHCFWLGMCRHFMDLLQTEHSWYTSPCPQLLWLAGWVCVSDFIPLSIDLGVFVLCRSDKDYDLMEARLLTIAAPSDIGRIIRRFSHKMSGLTAQQIMTFVNVYSLVVWRDFLHGVEMNLWMLLVRCSRLLSQHALTLEDRSELRNLLIEYAIRFQREYGVQKATPNQHMATHIVDYIELFGPPHTHWCYAWERHNGHLGRTPTNGHSYAITLMKRASQRDRVRLAPFLPEAYGIDPLTSGEMALFTSLTNVTILSVHREQGRAGTSDHESECTSGQAVLNRVTLCNMNTYITGSEPFGGGLVRPQNRLVHVESVEYTELTDAIKAVFPKSNPEIQLRIDISSSLLLGGMKLGSDKSRGHRSSYVLTSYSGNVYPAQVLEYAHFAVDLLPRSEHLIGESLGLPRLPFGSRGQKRRVPTGVTNTEETKEKRSRNKIRPSSPGPADDSKRSGEAKNSPSSNYEGLSLSNAHSAPKATVEVYYAHVRWFPIYRPETKTSVPQLYTARFPRSCSSGTENVWFLDRPGARELRWIPVQRIISRFVPAIEEVEVKLKDNKTKIEKVFRICPLPQQINL